MLRRRLEVRHPECTHEGSRDSVMSSDLEILRGYAQDDWNQKCDRTLVTLDKQ